MQELWKLFWIFFRIGAFTFGGGYVMIPIIQHEISEKHKLIDEVDLSEILVIAQSLPGMMAVNAATSVGFRLKGKVGAIVCALGVALPSFLIIVFLWFASPVSSHVLSRLEAATNDNLSAHCEIYEDVEILERELAASVENNNAEEKEAPVS